MTKAEQDLQALVQAQASQISDLSGNVRDVLQALEIQQRRREVFPFRSGLASELQVHRQACWLKSLVVTNVDPGSVGVVTYIQLFDASSPAAYKQIPDFVIPLDPSSVLSLDFSDGLYFSKGLYIAQSSVVESLQRHRIGATTVDPWNYLFGTFRRDN
jgi:hypothetical protein